MGQSTWGVKARMGGQHRLLLLCSLMGLARGQSAALRTTPTPVTPSPGCWYEALCAYSDDSDIKLTWNLGCSGATTSVALAMVKLRAPTSASRALVSGLTAATCSPTVTRRAPTPPA